MKKLVVALVLAISMSGCCLLAESDEALMREIRSTLVESTRPALSGALDKANKADGTPFYIEAYRDEKVNTVDTMVESIDRLYPPETPYVREALPWKSE